MEIVHGKMLRRGSEHKVSGEEESKSAREYGLSVSYRGDVRHCTIRTEDQCSEVEEKKKPFSSIQELVAFYKDHYLTVDGMTLVTPCPPPKMLLTPCKKFVVHTGTCIKNPLENLMLVLQHLFTD